MFGPLFVLKWKGTLCPCLENSQERAARTSLELVSNLPIVWLRNDSENKGLVNKLLFSPSSKKNGIPSVLTWMDGSDGPLLQVEPQSDDSTRSDVTDSPLQQSAGYMKTLSLSEIKVVEYKNDIITLGTRVGGKPKKLLAFQVVQHDEDCSPESIQQALLLLVTWESNRIPEEDREVDIDMNRALKAAHFCQRELELKRLKSEREKRKAKYLGMSRKNAGGMKYTAIAMANRADANSNNTIT